MFRVLMPFLSIIAMAMPVLAEVGDDGLHDAPFLRTTFKDLTEDFEEARGDGRNLIVLIEQRGCIYCKRMHEEVFTDPEVNAILMDDYFAVQIDMFGGTEVTDFDGVTRTEADMVKEWGYRFTPTIMVFAAAETPDVTAPQAALTVIPGALDVDDTLSLLLWAQSDAAAEGLSLSDFGAARLGN
ncbi:hypothetical protein AN189_15895 [Loktanella sp. 3ANDIMAR09]|uniref:thioredoxin family protein n=1 Tax=Loktanella sp. 3ANDIMAR09 TaxID=1225657 RepID=UPI000707D3D7|nr:thioredoxin family protein [Loktanella sp. 3ANDIMAR09]KQI67418.1 hypothetical protein AN189_15895 [Loktanella sp. 3ANDIMAR09]